MEDKNTNSSDSVELPKQGSGSILAAERKAQNKTVEDVAEELNLSVTQIRTIELDQTEGLPEPTYVRGYIRSYARILDLDPTQVLENYLNPNWQQSSKLDELPKGIGSALGAEDGSNSGGVARWLAVLLLITLVAFAWFSGWFNGVADVKPPLVSSELTSTPNTSSADIQPTTEDSSSVAPNSEAPTESVETGSAAGDLAENINELVLNFSQTSWIDIRDADDKRLAYRSYTKDEELIVSNKGRLNVFIGNAEGVNIKHNGVEMDLSPYREGVYAKFVIGLE
jgi:cytoskeleton protein RodZ